MGTGTPPRTSWLDEQRNEAKVSLRFAAVSWGVTVVAYLIGRRAGVVVVVIGGIALLGALLSTAKLVSHAIPLWLSPMSAKSQGLAQIALGVIGAIIPLIYFSPGAKPWSELAAMAVRGWAYPFFMAVIGFLAYGIGQSWDFRAPVRLYLAAVLVFALLPFVPHSNFSGDDEDVYEDVSESPLSDVDRDKLNYGGYTLACFIGITIGLARRGVRVWEPATLKGRFD
jgi:hypothetical protein